MLKLKIQIPPPVKRLIRLKSDYYRDYVSFACHFPVKGAIRHSIDLMTLDQSRARFSTSEVRRRPQWKFVPRNKYLTAAVKVPKDFVLVTKRISRSKTFPQHSSSPLPPLAAGIACTGTDRTGQQLTSEHQVSGYAYPIREKKGTDILLLEYQTYPNNPMHVLQM
ncbi:hypothetical protein Agabi119p4_2555 [Agaricus bisporus var. burnettii]|uniref:Uncharacterized protein n=1 Tax=Agaricus bisporus var. burnettii TaxID=192524 RepID=A0A8H7KK31_AGABI|nr:hypothetical protein Agabi119p4_2555 [Agaricus bisporus var. burnettii]